jgi:hypothetical protein
MKYVSMPMSRERSLAELILNGMPEYSEAVSAKNPPQTHIDAAAQSSDPSEKQRLLTPIPLSSHAMKFRVRTEKGDLANVSVEIRTPAQFSMPEIYEQLEDPIRRVLSDVFVGLSGKELPTIDELEYVLFSPPLPKKVFQLGITVFRLRVTNVVWVGSSSSPNKVLT